MKSEYWEIDKKEVEEIRSEFVSACQCRELQPTKIIKWFDNYGQILIDLVEENIDK